MTVPVHTFQVYSGVVTGAGPTTLYTVPAGYRLLLKAVNVMNNIGTAKSCAIQVDSGPALFSVTVPAASGVAGLYQWNGFAAYNAAQVIRYVGGASSNFSLNLSGYLYPLTL